MKNANKSRLGFTLIELLVVVLIIGILAAVALPQYQKAVEKARTIPLLSIMQSIVSAQEVFYLANGEYAAYAELLDIEMPAGYEKIEDNGNYATYSLTNGQRLHLDAHSNYMYGRTNKVQIDWTFKNHEQGEMITCYAKTGEAIGTSICKSMGTYVWSTPCSLGDCDGYKIDL